MAAPLSLSTPEEKAAYAMGWRHANDLRRVYVDLETEMAFPIDWSEYNSKEEREVIAAIVAMPEFQEHFKKNMLCQAMLKWRQARLAKTPEEARLCTSVGNFLMELIEFYEHAKDQDVQRVEDTDGFSSFPEPQ